MYSARGCKGTRVGDPLLAGYPRSLLCTTMRNVPARTCGCSAGHARSLSAAAVAARHPESPDFGSSGSSGALMFPPRARATCAALLVCALAGASAATADLPSTYGFVFAGEAWAHPGANYSSQRARTSLAALAASGSTAVRLLTFAYVDTPASTSVHGILPPSPLSTTATEDLAAFVGYAVGALNLSVTVSPILDLNWGLPDNFNHFAWYKPGAVSRADIGANFSSDDWDAFFASYTAWLVGVAAAVAPYAPARAARAGDCFERGAVATFSVGDDHVQLFGQADRMRALIAAVRVVYGGCITAAVTGKQIQSIGWFDAVDVISHIAFWPLGSPAPIGAPPSVGALTAAWAPVTEMLASVSAATGKQIVLSAVGAQSRPNCHVQPWATGAPGSGLSARVIERLAMPANPACVRVQVMTRAIRVRGLLRTIWGAKRICIHPSSTHFHPTGAGGLPVYTSIGAYRSLHESGVHVRCGCWLLVVGFLFLILLLLLLVLLLLWWR